MSIDIGTGKKKLSGKAKVGLAFFIIFILVIAFFLWGYFARTDHTNDMISKGCKPASFDRYGIPTLWMCPKGVN